MISLHLLQPQEMVQWKLLKYKAKVCKKLLNLEISITTSKPAACSSCRIMFLYIFLEFTEGQKHHAPVLYHNQQKLLQLEKMES